MSPWKWASYLIGRARIRMRLDPIGWFWWGMLIAALITLAVALGFTVWGH